MNATETRTFSVYLQKRGQRPKKVAEMPEHTAGAATFEHEGATYYNATVDITRRTVTFVDFRLSDALKASA